LITKRLKKNQTIKTIMTSSLVIITSLKEIQKKKWIFEVFRFPFAQFLQP